MKETMATSPPSASNTAAKAAKYREMAKDKSLPQDVRNTYLDKANEIEQASYKPSMAKGGMVKTPAKGMSKSPSIVIAVGMAKPSKKPMMNKGGMAKGKC
jgi:hypothetical protein